MTPDRSRPSGYSFPFNNRVPRNVITAMEVKASDTPEAKGKVLEAVGERGFHLVGGVSPIGKSRQRFGTGGSLLEAESKVVRALDLTLDRISSL